MSSLEGEWGTPGAHHEDLDPVPAPSGDQVGADDQVNADTAAGPDGLYYASLPDFVEAFLAPMFGRDLSAPALTWCPQWWRHAEAIYRLESLWRSWESLRLDPALGSSTWLRDHLDHHLPVLMANQGPFKGCSPEKGHQQRDHALPLQSPPPGFFSDETA